MMEYKVVVEQNIRFKEEIQAEFETYEGALAFCKVIFENCDNVKCTISRIEEEAE